MRPITDLAGGRLWGLWAALAVSAAGAALGTAAHAQTNYVLSDLGPSPSPATQGGAGTGVNQAGQVSGYIEDATALTFSAFRFDGPGATVGLPAPSGFDSFYATAISDGAAVAGVARVTATGAFQAAYNDTSSTVTLPIPAGDAFCAATGVNAAGAVVGHSYNTAGRFRAFLYTNSNSAPLATGAAINSDAYAVNGAGQVAAAADDATRHFHAVLAGGSPVALAGLAGATDTYAYGLNAAGDLAGESASDGASHAVLWPHGATTPTNLGLLPGASYGAARAVNAADVAVGDSGDVNYVTFRATLWDANGPHDLNAVLPAPNAATWTLTRATGINDAGQISGLGLNGSQPHGFLLTPIPNDATAQVTITRGAYARVSRTTTIAQAVTVTNTGAAALPGPLSLVLDGLTGGVTLTAATGTTRYSSPAGSPYSNMTAGLTPGASVTYALRFNDPSLTLIQYTPRVLAGAGVR